MQGIRTTSGDDVPNLLTDLAAHARTGPIGPVDAPAVEGAIERLRDVLLAGASPPVARELQRAMSRSTTILAGGKHDVWVRYRSALAFAADAIVARGAEGELAATDVEAAATGLAEVLGAGRDAAAFMLYEGVVAAPQLSELPPLIAISLQLRLLVDLGIFAEVSLWRSTAGEPECLVDLGASQEGRTAHREARATLGGHRILRLAGQSSYRSAPVQRFQQPIGALVGRAAGSDNAQADAFLTIAARALSPILEREFLLDRNQKREQSLVAASERRLTRLAYDLHDGPVQDVLALAGDVRGLQQDLDPFILGSHRELAWGRFDDALARLTELDRTLRVAAHSLETSRIASRPLGEVIHGVAATFAARTGVSVDVDVQGEVDALSDSQRIVIFRALQEALSNAHEHGGADSVRVVVRVVGSATEVSVTDDGNGFDVVDGLAQAVKRGRLGVVGINERVRLLGGTFDLDSQPGGPTTLRFTLPRWEPLAPVERGRPS